MLARRAGSVINVASVAGFVPGNGMADYCASKAGLRSLSEALWAETRGTGVTVSCLCPGPVATAFFDRAGVGPARLFRRTPKTDPARVAAAAWAGLRAARRIVLPNAGAWATAIAAPLLPIVRRIQQDRTRHA